MPRTVEASSLTPSDYEPFGQVVAAREKENALSANQGTAQRFNHLAELINLKPEKAKPNVCLFRSTPTTKNPFEVKLLERHVFSTQWFVPMGSVGRFLVIVCSGAEEPDLSTLRAFEASGSQSITYKPGVWHHPLIALDRPGDFTCLIYEDGGPEDCDYKELADPVLVPYRKG